MKRKYLGKTLGALALSSMVLFGCNGQNPFNDKPTQKVETTVVIDKNKLEDTFLKVVDSIKSGELDDFKITSNIINNQEGYVIEIPKGEYDIKFRISSRSSYNLFESYLIYVSADGDSEYISEYIVSDSEDVKNAFDYLSHGSEVKYEKKSLEEILFGKEQELNEEK